MPPVLASRIRVLSSGKSNKNDENDARSVAIAALRRDGLAEVHREDEAAVLRMLAKRHRELTALRTQAVCRLHAMLAVLRPGGMGHRLSAKQASRMLGGIRGLDAVGEQRRIMAKEHLADIRRLDRDLDANKARIRRAVAATDTTVTDIYGVGPVVAAFLIGYTPPIERFTTPDKYAAYNGTAPIEVSSGGKIRHRLSRRGNRTLNHAIHTAAITQISHHTTRTDLLRQETGRRQNRQRSAPGVETTHLKRRLPTTQSGRSTTQCLNEERVREDNQERH